ncbi:hypothetical protein OG809_33645 [Kribbella soli]
MSDLMHGSAEITSRREGDLLSRWLEDRDVLSANGRAASISRMEGNPLCIACATRREREPCPFFPMSDRVPCCLRLRTRQTRIYLERYDTTWPPSPGPRNDSRLRDHLRRRGVYLIPWRRVATDPGRSSGDLCAEFIGAALKFLHSP